MKKAKLFVMLMMVFAMLFAFDNTVKAASNEIDITISSEDELKKGEEVTLKIQLENNYEDVTFPAEWLNIEVYHSSEDMLPSDGWVLVDDSDVVLKSDEWLEFTNVKDFEPGDILSFEVKGTLAEDYVLGEEFTVWVSESEEYDWLAEETWPDMVEITTNFPMEGTVTVKRGATFNGKITVKNPLDQKIESLNLWIAGYPSAVQDNYETIYEDLKFTSDWEDVTLAPGETKDLNFTFTVPADLVSSTVWIDFSIDSCIEYYDEETDEYYEGYIETIYSWFKVEVEGGVLNPFKDVTENDWFSKYALFVYENGIMTGMNETTFGPTVGLSRAQFATILYRMDGQADVSELKNPFPDVPAGQFYTDAAIWAADAGVITGYNNGNFGPNDMITREQMATILFRYESYWWDGEYTGDDSVLSQFPDAANVSSFAKEGVTWAIDSGIITGDGGKINPQGTANRAQCATIVSRFRGIEE